jgi:hypothetical protein
MCKFASFVLTKDREFWSETGDSHSDIINQNNLHEWGSLGPNVVKVEITPTDKIKKWPSLKAWKFVVDQDELPKWFDAEEIEKRTRAALLRRFKAGFKTVYASGCTALTELKADAATTVYASGCTALTELKADAANYVYASGCTALTELKADAATTVDASGCTALTELKADAANYVYASGCNPNLKIKARRGATIYR